MKKILLYAVGCVVIVLCVVCYFAFTQTRELQECKNERDKISGCVEKEYVDAYGARLWFETPYKNGKKHGIAKRYYENGKLASEIPYKNGEPHGALKYYDDNGKLMSEASYENGKPHGMLKKYYENGNLEYETPFENGEQHGVAKEYYENGNVSYEAPYENGKLHGVVKQYYENGSLQAQVTYENGNIVSGVCGDGKEIPNIHGLEEQKDIIHKIFESCRE